MLFLSGASATDHYSRPVVQCTTMARFVVTRSDLPGMMATDMDEQHLETEFLPYLHGVGLSKSSVESTSFTMEQQPQHQRNGSFSICSSSYQTSTSSGSMRPKHHQLNGSLPFVNATGGTHKFRYPTDTVTSLSHPITTKIVMPQLHVQPSHKTAFPSLSTVSAGNDMEIQTISLGRAKLKQTSHVSALLAGFALVGMVEMDIDLVNSIPFGLMVFFIVNTTLLVSMHMIALLISTWILPHLASASMVEQQISALEALKKQHTDCSKKKNWPLKTLTRYINLAWSCSTVLGIFLFITELIAIVWVKFYNFGQPGITGSSGTSMTDGRLLALITTLLLLPVLIALFYLSCNFYFRLVLFRSEMQERAIDELNALADNLPAPHSSGVHLNLGYGGVPI